jgi:hypothetical protein
MEQAAIYDQFDFKSSGGYGAVENLKVGGNFIQSYICPTDPQQGELINCCSQLEGPDLGPSNMAGVADSEDWSCDGTWPRPDPSRQILKRGANGILYQRSKTSTKDITDGTNNTLILGEVIGAGPGTNQGFFWATWDLQHTGNGLNLPLNMDPKPSPWSVEENGFASYHPGGCHFALASGSVRFLNDSMDQAILQGLATRAGEEIVEY